MTILAIDTTSEVASVALRRDGQLLAADTLQSPEGFAHVIFFAVEQLLASRNIGLGEIDCFAAASGPGSFTGVRVGLALVKGLAEAENKPAAGISNLRALSTFGAAPFRAVMLDARRDQAFAAVYGSDLEAVVPEAVVNLAVWLEGLTKDRYEFISLAGSPLALVLKGTRFQHMPFIEAPQGLAAAIAECAELDGYRGRWQDAAALEANYVRQSDAELFWSDAKP